MPFRSVIFRTALASFFATHLGLAADTPIQLPLWPDKPPQYAEGAPAEIVLGNGTIENISIPAIRVYLPPQGKATGRALIICPGGGYHALDWTDHVTDAALYFLPRGIAVIGLKYRTNPPYRITKTDRSIPLLDLKRAVQVVRHHAVAWALDPHQVGVLGYSAGANLALTLAGQFDAGDLNASDPVARLSNRPDFVVSCATWHWHEKISPFTFRKNTPPIFFVHATNDGLPGANGKIGGAPIELPYAIKAQLDALGVPAYLDIYGEGAHGVGNLIPQRVLHNFPPTKWPEHLQKWLEGLDPKFNQALSLEKVI